MKPTVAAGWIRVSATALSLAACEAVPDLHFVSDDASALVPEPDASALPGADGGTTPGSTDAATEAATSGCDSPVPSGGVCCGTTWCVGQCTNPQKNCNTCATNGCARSEICCARGGNVACQTTCPP